MNWERQQEIAKAELDRLAARDVALPAGTDFGPSTEEVYEFWRTVGFPDDAAAHMASIDRSPDWRPLAD